MKKYSIACAVLCLAMAFASCGSSKESVYRKAYEKAKAQESAQQQTQNPEVAQAVVQQPVQQPVQQQPVQEQPATVQQTVEQPVVTPLQEAPAQKTVTSKNNAGVRTETVKVVNGNGLKAYSVVVGSFSVRANAEGLQNTLNKAGYQAQVAYNESANMYRVIATTFDTKDSADSSRDNFRSTYPGAWILFQK